MSQHQDIAQATTPQDSTPDFPAEGEYWSTLSELDRDEAYLAQIGEEFYPSAKPENAFEKDSENALLTPMHRRTFLKLSGFAAVFASLSGCERPVQKIIPYVNKPEEIIPGIPNYYASTCVECPAACGLLVKTREGRPIKLEGNPEHPMNKGAICTRGQAGILRLYDPDRQKYAARVGRNGADGFGTNNRVAMEVVDEVIAKAIQEANGRKVVLLSSSVSGPANTRLIDEFLSTGSNFEHVVYDPNQGGETRKAHGIAFGEEVTPRYRWEKARAIVTLGGDPLAQSHSKVEAQAGISAGRKPSSEGMSRLISFEPTPTMTGMMADYRHPVRPGDLLRVGLAIAHELILNQGQTDYANNSQLRSLLQDHSPTAVASAVGTISAADITRAAKALLDNAGHSILHVTSGATRTEKALELELLACFLNHALGNYGNTIDVTKSPSNQANGSTDAILALVEDMKAGRVGVLLVNGVNPVYTLPPSVGFGEAMGSVGLVVSMNLSPDETSALADYILPGVHGLESWGDAEPQKGLYSIQQPTIRTLYGEAAADKSFQTRSWQESLIAILRATGSQAFTHHPTRVELEELAAAQELESIDELDEEARTPRQLSWHDFLRETWESQIYTAGDFAAPDFRKFWIGVVREGYLDTVGIMTREEPPTEPTLSLTAVTGNMTAPSTTTGRVLVTQPTIAHGDGVSMGNPQLLELPDPVSKVCWDNYAAFSPRAAEELRIREGDHVTITVSGESLTLPAWIQPGQHPDVVAINLGWGRNTMGGLGDGVGFNAARLHTLEGGKIVSSGQRVEVSKARGNTRLANTQGHNYLYSPTYGGIMVNRRVDSDAELAARGDVNHRGDPVYARPIVGETTWNEWKKNPYHGYPNSLDPGENAPPSIWEGTHKYVGHHWGMSVDLNACNGCGACIVACSIENNVPVVGKEEVLMGREMHWIRIDRYHRGNKENPDFVHMPLMCQHCDNAPCETVCPVIATMHNDEGLNVMTYNRCVGTRYCANNCPYKVRRFNFWDYYRWRSGPYGDGPEGDRKPRRAVAPLEMVLNPDITTRTRGVMEKCSFCVGRIRHAKDKARDAGVALQDGDLLTACQQTCPAKAITFGDRNDETSKVAADWKDPRGYGLLADMNTDPSVRYLGLVRNRDEASPYRTKYQSLRLKKEKQKAEESGE